MQQTTPTFVTAKRVANADMTGWLPDHAVRIENGRLTDVLPSANLPDESSIDGTVLHLGDVSLMPGLIDAHCHMHCSATVDAQDLTFAEMHDVGRLKMRAVTNLRKALMAGTTTVRDIGSRNEVAFDIKRAINEGAIPGPRLLVAGTPITITAGHCWFFGTEADTADEVAKAVRRQVRLGADAIKIMATGGMFTPTANPRQTQYPASTLRVAVEEAGRSGIPVAAHTLAADGVRNCVEANVLHIIHGRWFHRDATQGLDYDADAVARMADQGQWVDPTIGHMMLGNEAVASGTAEARKPHWSVSGTVVPEAEHLTTLRMMRDAGVRFTSGLDMGMAHGTHDRSAANAWAVVELLGFSNWDALRMATSDTAEALDINADVGNITRGKIADLAAFDGDPGANIRDMDQASTVMQSGRLVKHEHKVLA